MSGTGVSITGDDRDVLVLERGGDTRGNGSCKSEAEYKGGTMACRHVYRSHIRKDSLL